jgi:hypothetical protein
MPFRKPLPLPLRSIIRPTYAVYKPDIRPFRGSCRKWPIAATMDGKQVTD